MPWGREKFCVEICNLLLFEQQTWWCNFVSFCLVIVHKMRDASITIYKLTLNIEPSYGMCGMKVILFSPLRLQIWKFHWKCWKPYLIHTAKLFWTLSKKFRGNSEDSFKIYSLSAFKKGGKSMIYQFLTSKYISLFYFDNFGSYRAGGEQLWHSFASWRC